jgi:hypothetical protein
MTVLVADEAHVDEHLPSKQAAAGSRPVIRSILGSSNGRTPAFEAEDVGSIPTPRATPMPVGRESPLYCDQRGSIPRVGSMQRGVR